MTYEDDIALEGDEIDEDPETLCAQYVPAPCAPIEPSGDNVCAAGERIYNDVLKDPKKDSEFYDS